jgi:hypothetical protein
MDWDRVKSPPSKRPDPPAPTLLRLLWTMRKSREGEFVLTPDRVITAGDLPNPDRP